MIVTPRLGSQISWKMTVAPILRPSNIPAAKPVMWPSGEQTNSLSPPSSLNRSASEMLQAISVFRQCMTPLGEPVVPDVNISTAISSAGSAPISPAGGGGKRSASDSSRASKLDAPPPSTAMTCFSFGNEACSVRPIAS